MNELRQLHGNPALPKLLVGRRRKLMALLVGAGLCMAALSGASAFLMKFLLKATDSQARLTAVAGLLAVAGGIGLGHVAVRVLAERLGQSYIQELRRGLMTAVLAKTSGPSAGITIARITNDLSSVRNWVSMGIAPLAVGIPLIAGTTAALWLLSPPLAIAMALPLGALSLALVALARPAFIKARKLRRKRGQLAAQVSDTLAAAVAIRAGGGERREVEKIYRLGGEVASAAIDRARVGGFIRASAGASGVLTAAIVAATGSWLAIQTATTAAALTLVGLLAHHVNDLARAAEYRQTFNAAKRIIGPALFPGTIGNSKPQEQGMPQAGDSDPVRTSAKEDVPGDFMVRISGLRLRGNRTVPDLIARPGDRIVLITTDPDEATELFEMLLDLRTGTQLIACVDGQNLRSASGSKRRRLAGYAAKGTYTERGSVARAVRYRRPDLPEEETAEALARVELADRVAQLPKGEHTVLRRGGEPLTVSDRARLQIARATFGNPPLLLLNHIDFDLGQEGRKMLASILRIYPGVAIIASDHPADLVAEYSTWDLR